MSHNCELNNCVHDFHFWIAQIKYPGQIGYTKVTRLLDCKHLIDMYDHI